MCLIVLRSLSFTYREARIWFLSSECNIELAYFTDWMSFLPYNLIKEINPNPKAASTNG